MTGRSARGAVIRVVGGVGWCHYFDCVVVWRFDGRARTAEGLAALIPGLEVGRRWGVRTPSR